MDKNQAIGFTLMAALLMVYFYFFAPQPPQQPEGGQTDTISTITNKPKAATPKALPQEQKKKESNLALPVAAEDTAEVSMAQFGIFSNVLKGKEKEITIENNLLELKYSTKGGLVKRVALKEYDDYQYKFPLVLLDEQSSRVRYIINTQYGSIDLADLYYRPDTQLLGDTTVLTFTADLATGMYIKHIYKLAPDDYYFSHKFIIYGLENEMTGNNVSMIWDNKLKRLETDIDYSRNYTTVNYWLVNDQDMEALKPRSSDKQEVTFNQPVSWFAFKQKFFTSGFAFNKPITSGYFSSYYDESDTVTVKYCRAVLDLPLNHFTEGATPNKQYFGPNKLKYLKRVATGFDENLYLGWPVVKWINKYVIITIFNFLEKHIGSYGIIIIILVFIIKLILSPLTYKSHIQMAKTKALKPELDELKKKFGGDMQKMQAEQMKLYSQVGVNPLSGCIPMLLQMPILFAMFQFIPHAVELRHESFLWAHDLSTYDSILTWSTNIPLISSFYGNHVSLFTLLMTISTILYTWINSQSTAQMEGPMKSMQYFMPVIFMFVLNKFPAGLTFYYFVSNLVSFGQIAVIRKFVDDEKIRAILEENKKRNQNKKKSKFQARLDEALKATEQAKKKKKGKK